MLRSPSSNAKKLTGPSCTSEKQLGQILLLEPLKYLPFRRNNRVVIPLNRNWMLGPCEKRAINIQAQFSDIQMVEDATRPNYVQFHAKTDGRRIWGIIVNHSQTAMALTPKSDLCNVTSSATHISIPDKGLVIIENRDKPSVCMSMELKTEKRRCEFPTLFHESLGECRHHVVRGRSSPLEMSA